MDQNTLVEVDADVLNRIATAFRSRGIPVSGVYLTKLTSENGYEDRIIRLVSERDLPNLKRKMIYELVTLRRENALPKVDSGIRFDIVPSNDPEASRVIEYTRELGGPPVLIRDVMWKGLFIEYALVASVPQTDVALA